MPESKTFYTKAAPTRTVCSKLAAWLDKIYEYKKEEIVPDNEGYEYFTIPRVDLNYMVGGKYTSHMRRILRKFGYKLSLRMNSVEVTKIPTHKI